MRKRDYNLFIQEALAGMGRHRNCKPLFQTITFKQVDFNCEERFVQHCFRVSDCLYQHICSNLIRNHSRPTKRHLQPVTYAFIDVAGSSSVKIAKIERVPHIHSIVLADGSIALKYQRFINFKLKQDLSAIMAMKKIGSLPSIFQSSISCIATVDLQEVAPGQLETVLRYSSKLLTHPVASRQSLFLMNPDTTKFRKVNRNVWTTSMVPVHQGLTGQNF
jgi:hypothetical protein